MGVPLAFQSGRGVVPGSAVGIIARLPQPTALHARRLPAQPLVDAQVRITFVDPFEVDGFIVIPDVELVFGVQATVETFAFSQLLNVI